MASIRPGAPAAQCYRPNVEESQLVDAWRGGDQAAASLLVERHFSALYRFFRSKVSGDVEDLVQQTFLGCLEMRERFRGEACFRTLLFRIARRRLYDHFRERRRTNAIDFTTTSARALGTSPSACLQRTETIAQVREAMQELSVDDQMLLELRYWEELSTEELARVFDVAPGTIKSRQFRARAELIARLRSRGVPVDDAARAGCPATERGALSGHIAKARTCV